jgi:hypothetical protein
MPATVIALHKKPYVEFRKNSRLFDSTLTRAGRKVVPRIAIP